jgi:P4 family phage/plasmid primase-like protien
MKFTIYTADCTGNPQNKMYPHETVITSAADMKKSARFDHVCARYTSNSRSEANFLSSDNVPMDCDNSHSENPDDWITPEALDAILPDVAFSLIFSRNHMKEKEGNAARPRFHVYFPTSLFQDATAYKALKKKIQQQLPFFDGNALDAARFFFGSDGDVIWHEGSLTIEDYMLLMQQKKSIPAGQRNNTLSRYAGKLVKRFGTGEEAHRKFLERATECNPPLDDEELETIWKSASKFGKRVSRQEGYIPPEQYADMIPGMIPADFSDIGQARTFVDMYDDEVCYTTATDFLRYNGTYWVESEQRAIAAMMEHTDEQLREAEEMIEASLTKLEELGIDRMEVIGGGKKFISSLTSDEAQVYRKYELAKSYKSFVMKYRNMRSLRSALDAAKPGLEKAPDELDNSPFLLNTPGGTYDLQKGLDGWDVTNPADYLTKITTVVPSDEGMDIWLEAVGKFFCGDKELIEYVQMICGLCLIGKVYIEALIIAYGDGRNGKSTFWNVIFKVLGSYSGNMSADALTVNCKRNVKPELAELKGKRLIIAAELQEGMRLNTSVVKQLCSTDPIFAEKKFKAPFTFEPSHTLVLYTNHLPKVSASDDGTWRRLIVIPFHAKITGKDDRKNYTQYLVENAGGAVLSWLIEGARKVIAADFQIEPPQCVKDAIGSYRDDNDWLGRFLAECCEIDKTYRERSGELYQEYRRYCAENGEFARSTTDFYGALDQAGFERKKTSSVRVILGLRIKSEDFLD